MKIGFHGAARTVPGSKYLLTLDHYRLLVDCGLFQGGFEMHQRNWRPLAFSPASVDDVLFTHAHIDHTGYFPRLAADGFIPNAVVTLQKVGADAGNPQQILDAQTKTLAKKLKVTDMQSTQGQVCGSPAQAITYTAPKMGKIPARKATSLAAVLQSGDASYVATVTVQTVKAADPTYAEDSAAIIKGFQILPPK